MAKSKVKKKKNDFPKEVRAKMTKVLKNMKEHLSTLDKLVFLPDETAHALRERLRQEIINLEKELS